MINTRGVSKAFLGAIYKGMQARLDGLKLSDCPYEDKRKSDGYRLTWSRAFESAWRDGWLEADKNPDEAKSLLRSRPTKKRRSSKT